MGTESQPPVKKLKEEEASLEMKIIWKPRPILAEEITQEPVLEKAFIGILKDKKGISKAITGLANCLPSPQHLKRCSGLKIYLAPTSKTSGDPKGLKKFLIENKFDITLLEDEFEIVDVPSSAVKTKAQMSNASKCWPVNFHPDLNLEALISGSLFNADQLASIEVCMRLAIKAAADSIGSEYCNGSALIISPDDGKILAITASRLDQHPMWHASMLAVDLVAKGQGSGAWKLLEDQSCELDSSKRKFEDASTLYYPDCLTKLELPKDGTLTFTRQDQKKLKDAKKELPEKCGPYLCTGYWAILLQEPCPLCAMALLHSRVSRIFYGAANRKTGILGSKATLHSVPGLNHRYQVWAGVLENECEKIVEKCRRVDN